MFFDKFFDKFFGKRFDKKSCKAPFYKGLRVFTKNVLTNEKKPRKPRKTACFGAFLVVPAVGLEPTTDTL